MTHETRFEDYLAVETAGGASWHPDGKRIAFTSNATGHYQIYTCYIEYGNTLPRIQVTDEEDRCTDPRYLSDGSLIFTRDRGGDENFQIGLIEADGSQHWLTSDLGTKHRISRASKDYIYYIANLTDRSRLDVYRRKIPLRKNEPELIYEPEQGVIFVDGTSDDNSKILMTQYFGNMDQHILLLDVSDGNISDLTEAISGDAPVRWEVVRWLNSEHILVSTDFKADFKRLAIISTTGEFNPFDDLSEHVQFEIEKYTHSKDSIWTYFVENQEGYSTIHRAKFSVEGVSEFETLPFPLRGVIPAGDARSWVAGLRLSDDENRLAVTVSSGIQPTNVWILSIKDMTSWKAIEVSFAGLDPTTFVESTLHRFYSYDGLSVPYFRYIPQGDTPIGGWPTLLIIHGGPEAQMRPDFLPVVQFYLSSGFAVVTPNIRGSAGYGRKYLDLDNVEKRLDSIKDIKQTETG
ncbi:MAG: S9 family peptidase [Candidatus Thorarchaeota archaeon]|jgi:dipeptidyl aminopeptidase/acylaminoacyl peptidase